MKMSIKSCKFGVSLIFGPLLYFESAFSAVESIDLRAVEGVCFYVAQSLVEVDTYPASDEAEAIYNKAMNAIALSPRIFQLRSASVDGAVAANVNGNKYILYNEDVVRSQIVGLGRQEMVMLSLLAHEIGHHLNGHLDDLEVTVEEELQAEYYSGVVLRQIGASEAEVLLTRNFFNQREDSSVSLGEERRIDAIRNGYRRNCSFSDCQSLVGPANYDPNAGLLHHFPFDVGLKDESGVNSIHGIDGGVDTRFETAVVGKGGKFTGANFVSVDASNLNKHVLTFSFWFRVDSFPDNENAKLLLRDDVVSNRIFQLYVVPERAIAFYAMKEDSDNWSIDIRTEEGAVEAGKWTHLLLTISQEFVAISLDGIERVRANRPNFKLKSGAAPLHIGGTLSDSKNSVKYGLRGMIDDLRIYNKVLSFGEANSLLNKRSDRAFQ